MFAFLQNLLPRLRQYSQSLDQTELFVDKSWVLIDEDGRQQTYIFRRGGELLMSLDGQVQMGKWDYIAPAQSLLVDRGVDKLLLNHFFFTDALLVLARDGKADSKFVLANRQLIPDLNIEKYLNALEARKAVQSSSIPRVNSSSKLHQCSSKSLDGTMLTFFTVKADVIAVGDVGYIDGQLIPNGRHITMGSWGFVVKDGVIESIFWPKQYELKTGQQIIIDCKGPLLAPDYYGRAYWPSGVLLEDGIYNTRIVGKIRVGNGLITSFLWF